MTGEGSVDIEGRRIGQGHPIFIIAEIGVNHNGDPDLARKMVEAAANAGADAVKFQVVDADASYARGHPSHAAFAGRALSEETYVELSKLARDRGVVPFTTPGDLPSLDLCLDIGFPAVKISSGLMTNMPLVRRAARTGLPLVVSTGMTHLWEVARTVHAVEEEGCRDLVLLQCVSRYPAPDEAAALRGIRTLAKAFPTVPVGYSDHTTGRVAAVAATALGARALEKHLVLDGVEAPDADIALTPDGFRVLVEDVRRAEKMLERRGKGPDEEEASARPGTHRSLVAHADIAEGELLTADNVGLKRAAGEPGLPAALYDEVLGCRAVRDVARDEPIGWDCITDRSGGGGTASGPAETDPGV